MIPFPYNYVAAVVTVGGALMASFAYGKHTATVKAERDALTERVAMYRSVELLATGLRKSDAALLVEQKRTGLVRREEVIKYVDRYRTKIVEVPHIVECIDNSGLLELINRSNPTVSVNATEQRPND